MKKITVVIVTAVPQLSHPQIQAGIRNREEAERWAEKHGYATVYLFDKKERVYADRLTVEVQARARQIERESDALVKNAESGGIWLEYAVISALVVLILVILGVLLGWPW